jgi:hypothetical protein
MPLRDWLRHLAGPDAWSEVVSRFYDRAAADPDIAGYFTGVDPARLQRHFLAALMIVTGQGVTVGVVRRMHAAHAGVCTPTGQPITEATWNATIEYWPGCSPRWEPHRPRWSYWPHHRPDPRGHHHRTACAGSGRPRPGRLRPAHPRPAHHRPARQRRHQQLPDLWAVLAVFRAGHRDRSPRPGVTGTRHGPPPIRLPPTRPAAELISPRPGPSSRGGDTRGPATATRPVLRSPVPDARALGAAAGRAHPRPHRPPLPGLHHRRNRLTRHGLAVPHPRCRRQRTHPLDPRPRTWRVERKRTRPAGCGSYPGRTGVARSGRR